MDDKKFAILIDSDNISSKYISYILDEMTKYGTITYKRIYGDWTSTNKGKWKIELLKNSIIPIQQFSNTIGKNATDSALIIDAMDILYANGVDGFCIVSSDSDFTRLASRLCESGKTVIGMGEEKTPHSFKNACTVFTNLELLIDQDEEDTNKSISKENIENYIASIVTENAGKGKSTGLSELGNRLLKKYSDFDVRKYGYSTLSKFVEESDRFILSRKNRASIVELKENEIKKQELDQYIIGLLQKCGQSGMELGLLGQNIHNTHNNFNVKEYGYSTLAKFIQSMSKLEIRDNKMNNKVVYFRGQ